MTDTTGNFPDLVQFSADTLYVLGESLIIGNSAATSVGHGWGNSAGTIVVQAAATANATMNLPTGTGGTLLNELSAGTQVASGTAVLSNSNGISFGMSGSSQVTAVYGGFSNWQNGAPITTFVSSSAFVSFQPVVIPYAITVTNVLLLGSVSQGTASSASSGGINVSFGLYTLTGGSSGTWSRLTSASTFLSWTSGGAYSSQSGVGFRAMSVASWSLTPGPYMVAVALASTVLSSISVTLFGTASLLTIGASGQGTQLSTMPMVPSYSASSVTALPASFGVSQTASLVQTGSSAYQQPWVSFQGT